MNWSKVLKRGRMTRAEHFDHNSMIANKVLRMRVEWRNDILVRSRSLSMAGDTIMDAIHISVFNAVHDATWNLKK